MKGDREGSEIKRRDETTREVMRREDMKRQDTRVKKIEKQKGR